jgi:mRNA interferase YafQ
MYTIRTTNRFEKDVKLCQKRGYDLNLLKEVMLLLSKNGSLPIKYKPHKLSGNYQDCWECHIKPNWLLVWKQDDTELILLFTNTSTHADLF